MGLNWFRPLKSCQYDASKTWSKAASFSNAIRSVHGDVNWPNHQFTLNPSKTRGWLNQSTRTLKACGLVLEGIRIVKPSCKYYFWSLKQLKNIILGGCIKKFLKKIHWNFFFIYNIEEKIFENPIFVKKIISHCAFLSQIWI